MNMKCILERAKGHEGRLTQWWSLRANGKRNESLNQRDESLGEVEWNGGAEIRRGGLSQLVKSDWWTVALFRWQPAAQMGGGWTRFKREVKGPVHTLNNYHVTNTSAHCQLQRKWPRVWRQALENGLILLRAIASFYAWRESLLVWALWKPAPTVTSHALIIWQARCGALSKSERDGSAENWCLSLRWWSLSSTHHQERRQGIPTSLGLGSKPTHFKARTPSWFAQSLLHLCWDHPKKSDS